MLQNSATKRQDIQCLRAWAIILVILFHFFPKLFPNGWVGVDMFFVISGYLIGMIICKCEELNFNTIRTFYYRRIKRIFPLYYLTMPAVLVAMYAILPDSFYTINSKSAFKAAFLVANLKNIDNNDDNYEVLLTNAEDLFTHTWSLCVEIQWYLLVPLIFSIQRFTRINGMHFFIGIGTISLIYHLSSPQMEAFNSVLARIWQFSSGVSVHFITQTGRKNINRFNGVGIEASDKMPLITESLLQDDNNNDEEEPFDELKNLYPYITNFLFVLILVTFSWSTEEPHHLRIEMTFLTAVLIAIGRHYEAWILSNPLMNYIGNVSYSLYLVHWPTYVMMKYFYPHSDKAMIIGVCISLFIACAIYHLYEQNYLRLSAKPIFLIITVLFLSSIFLAQHALITKLLGRANKFERYDIDITDGDPSTDLSVAIAINYEEAVKSVARNRDSKGCKHIRLNMETIWRNYGICRFTEKPLGKFKMLAIGNSYACNQAGVIYQAFKNFSRDFIVSCEPACEVLSGKKQHPICQRRINQTSVFEFVRPNVLFIIQRILVGKTPFDTTKPVEEDKIYQEHRKRLKYFEKQPFVKKIYLLTAFPSCVKSCGITAVNWMEDENKMLRLAGDRFIEYDDEPGRLRYAKLAKTCSKCQLIDYKEILKNKNGKITMYDDTTNLMYQDNFGHFTKFGLDRIKPVYDRLADEFRIQFARYLRKN